MAIHPIWKKIGSSTHQIAKQIAISLGEKTSHTGTLDPMAEGVIIVLSGEDRLKKYEYAKWKKVYVFELVFGIETDTGDALGVVTGINLKDLPAKNQIKPVLESFEGEYVQEVPHYAAIKVKGKPMHWYARNNRLGDISIPKRVGTIKNFDLLEVSQAKTTEVLQKIYANIQKTSGDLRQKEVTENWKALQEKLPENVLVGKISVETSKGIYVRRLAWDIANKFNTFGFCLSIKRTENGEFTKDECEVTM